MATRKKSPTVLSKADVSLAVPGVATRFALVGSDRPEQQIVSASRRQQMDIYYQMYAQHPTVRAGVEKIAKVATANGYIFQPVDPEQPLDKSQASVLRDFFRRSGASQLLRLTYKDLAIFGQAFWWIERARNGRPVRAKRLHPKYIDIVVTDGAVSGYRYGPVGAGKGVIYEPSVILNFRLDDPDNDVYGLSLLRSLQTTVASDLFAMEYNGNFFENSAQTGLVINMKNSSVDEVARNREWLEQNYVGSKNAHRPLILEGDIEIQKSVSTPQEMQFIEGRKFNREEILSVLDIPSEKVGFTENSNRSTSKEGDNNFRTETIAPLQTVVEEEISNNLILGMFGFAETVFAHREVSKRDQIENTKMLVELQRMGVISANEIRSDLGLGMVEGGDVNFVQSASGMIPLALIEALGQKILDGQANAATSISGLATDGQSGNAK